LLREERRKYGSSLFDGGQATTGAPVEDALVVEGS